MRDYYQEYMRTFKQNIVYKALKCFVFLYLIELFAIDANAQTSQDGLGSWNILNARLRMTQTWSTFFEGQIRSIGFYTNYHYYEYKAGVTYRIGNNFALSGSVGKYVTFQETGNFENPKQQDETRTWLQVAMNNQLGRVRFEHRYRAEQRFTLSGYRNRFRYRLGILCPINNTKIEPGTFYLSINDEIFFTDKEPYFERNRLFLGVGYEYSPTVAFQIGYLNQFDYNLTDETGRDFLQISLLLNIDYKHLSNSFIPNSMN